MDLSAFPLPDAWAVLAWVVAVPMFAVAFARVHWRAVADGPAARLWPAAVAALIGLWSIRAHVGSHLAFHLSGIAALTLACGAPLALVGGAVVVGASIAWSGANPANAAAAWLAGVALPALVVTAVRHAAAAWLPRNLFVFVFVVAYFGAAIAYVATGAAGTATAFAPVFTKAAGASPSASSPTMRLAGPSGISSAKRCTFCQSSASSTSKRSSSDSTGVAEMRTSAAASPPRICGPLVRTISP